MLDPSSRKNIKKSQLDPKEDAFEHLDRVLNLEDDSHLIILGGTGMGKTSLLLNYYLYNNRKKKNKEVIAIVPLNFKDADQRIENIRNKNEKVIFLDALDEDPNRSAGS